MHALIARARRVAERAINWAAIIVFAGIFACMFVQVILRYAFDSPLTWSEELARYLMIWCAFLGWVIASRNDTHLAMTFVVDKAGLIRYKHIGPVSVEALQQTILPLVQKLKAS